MYIWKGMFMNEELAIQDIEEEEEERGEGNKETLVLEFHHRERIRQDEGAVEYGARLFASGVLLDRACEIAHIRPYRLREFLNSSQGKALLESIRSELDEEFKNLYAQTIDTLYHDLRNPNPQVHQGAASLFLRHAKEIKVKLDITAEDLVKKIMG